MNEIEFLKNYTQEFNELIQRTDVHFSTLINAKKAILEASNLGKKTIIIGNGGSAAIASHFSVDITKNAGVRAINFNESDLLTCFSNDFGYEEWAYQAVKMYGDPGDILIAISSSGKSKNILNACKSAKEKSFSQIITLSGMSNDNPLNKEGDLNFWVDSKAYNHVENIHQFLLLSLVDLIIGNSVYSA